MLITSFRLCSCWHVVSRNYGCHGQNVGQTAKYIMMTATFGNSANAYVDCGPVSQTIP